VQDAGNGEALGFPWLSTGLAVSCLALFFQVFPSAWWAFVGVVDARGWTWRTYAVLCALAIGWLVYLKSSQDNA